jgi:hypothetical protein
MIYEKAKKNNNYENGIKFERFDTIIELKNDTCNNKYRRAQLPYRFAP